MTKRKRWAVTALAFVVGAAAVAWTIYASLSPINRDSFERIQEGMTVAEVEAILGGPPRDDAGGPVGSATDLPVDPESNAAAAIVLHYADEWNADHDGRRRVWVSNTVVILVRFDDAGSVEGRLCLPVERESWWPFAAIRRRLGL